jgi:APA family basic amino acid/polyamine antiporter
MTPPDTPARLKQTLSLVDIVTLGVGSAVGVSMFAALPPAAALAGPWLLASLAIAAAPMAVFALIYAVMGSALPTTGASYEWPRRFVHPLWAFLVAWLRLAGSAAAMVVLAQMLVQYLSVLAPLSAREPVMAAAFFTAWALNTLGVSIAARAQLLMMIVMLVVLGALVASGAGHVDAANLAGASPGGALGVLAAIPLMAGLFFGLEAATEMGEEVKSGGRNVALGMLSSLVLTTLIYLAVAATALGVLGWREIAGSDAPLSALAARVMGQGGGDLIAIIAVAAIGKTLNVMFMIFARTLMAMGRSGALPSAFARVHPKFGTPWVATTVTLGVCLLGLLLPADLVFLFIAVNVPVLLKYGSTSLAVLLAMRRDSAILERSTIKLPRAWMQGLCIAGVVLALALIALGWSADWRPYAALGVWAVIGAAYWFARYALFRP